MKQRMRTGGMAAALLAALVILAACSTKPASNGAPAVVELGGTPPSGSTGANPGGSPAPGSSAAGSSATSGTPKPGSTSTPTTKPKGGATPGSTSGSQPGTTGNRGQVNYNPTSGTFTITYPTPGSTFSFPGQIGGNPTPQSTNPNVNPSASPTACTLPAAPTVNGVGVTAVHLYWVDSSKNPHGPQTTFAASSVHSILVVANLDPSVNVTGTVITYAQLLCSNVESTQDLTLSGPTSTGQLYIRFDAPPGQNFPTGKYRLIFYVNPSSTNTQPAQYIDYVIN